MYTKPFFKTLLVLFNVWIISHQCQLTHAANPFPIVVNTWGFTNATDKAWETISSRPNGVIDAVIDGCTMCETLQCDGTVGYGGSPDETGETTLDAMVMDGNTMAIGAVADLRRVKNVVAVARAVMLYTEHSIMVGESATQFAVDMGFVEENLSTNVSINIWKEWRANNCQPNFRQNVAPDPTGNCGPYKPNTARSTGRDAGQSINERNHDTIGMIAVDATGHFAAATSTNGANHKVPGRVGDSPIVGAGCYADSTAGAASATGDGDTMMRFLPSYQAVESMRRGMSPFKAARDAIQRILKYYPSVKGAVIAMNVTGSVGAACAGFPTFPYSIRNSALNSTQVYQVKCFNP